VKNTEQGKEIEKQLYSLLPNSLNIELLKIDNDLSLIVCSPAAEDIFQQSNLILIVFIYISIYRSNGLCNCFRTRKNSRLVILF
jgi:hypothetical protein